MCYVNYQFENYISTVTHFDPRKNPRRTSEHRKWKAVYNRRIPEATVILLVMFASDKTAVNRYEQYTGRKTTAGELALKLGPRIQLLAINPEGLEDDFTPNTPHYEYAVFEPYIQHDSMSF
jgi:hypothetical protein